MDFRVIKMDERLESNWSGGKTWELAIYPTDARYLDRDFLWRLSTADSSRDESSFTKLPDYDRILMVLEGDVVLAHGDQRSVHLKAREKDAFDGAVKTRCYGRLIRDYNLIYRKGCRGRMELITLHETARPIAMSADAADHAVSYGIFCLDDYAVVTCGESSGMIRPGEQAVVTFPDGVQEDIHVMGQGAAILTEVIMEEAHAKAGRTPGETGGDDGPADGHGPVRTDAAAGSGTTGTAGSKTTDTAGANTTGAAANAGGRPANGMSANGSTAYGASAADRSAFADYKACLKLFMGRNRWAMIMRREGKSDVYYDRALSKALRALERRYITMIIWIVGMLICAIPAFLGANMGTVVVILVLFTLVHLLLIAPCVYMKFLPRPLCDHMKSTAVLNAAEQAYHQEEISEDPHFDRLMKKYNSDEEGYFTDESSPLHRFVKRK